MDTPSESVIYLLSDYIHNVVILGGKFKKTITMQQGTVKFFNTAKGFGFITPANGGADVFVHATALQDEIQEGDKVSFDVENGKKGVNAVNVKRI